MLQRIQSIFLLVTSTSFFLQFIFHFASSDKSTPHLLTDQIYNIMDNPVLIVIAGLGGAIGLVSIFLFNNRSLQLRLGYILIVLCILLPLAAFLLIYNEGTLTVEGTTIEDGLGLYLPLVGLVATILANRSIKKDDKLVKSMDRLR